MQIFYCDQFVLPLPPGHRFPMDKYARLRERLGRDGQFDDCRFLVPEPAPLAALQQVHEPQYLRQLLSGELPRAVQRRIGFPWSEQLVERSRRSVGGTMAAAAAALREGVAVNLAGGTHHAFADTGAGFCVLNDVVVAARWCRRDPAVTRVLVVDLDVHQGDGTAALCRDDADMYTFSMHGSNNYPARKQVSDLDVALADGTGDTEYLAALEQHLAGAVATAQPDLAFYLAGADPYHGDRLGRLALSMDALARRDTMVLETLAAKSIPVAVVMAGGYARQVEEIVQIHFQTVSIARAIHGKLSPGRPALVC